MEVVIITSIFLLICGLLFVIWNLYKKVTKYEKTILDYQNLFYTFYDIFQKADEKLKEIDVRGSFSSDDEIGFFFKDVKNIQKTLFDFLEKIFQ